MMHPDQKRLLAMAVLRKGKQLVPDRFPQPGEETTKVWADALGPTMEVLPHPELWELAVDIWAVDIVGDRMCTPREIRRAVTIARDRWESDPVRRPALDEARRGRVLEHDRQIAAGTRGEVLGYRRPAALEGGPARRPENVPLELSQEWRSIVGRFKTSESAGQTIPQDSPVRPPTGQLGAD